MKMLDKSIGKLVTAYFEEQKEVMLLFLKQLVEIESPSRRPELQEPIFEIIVKTLQGTGYLAQRIPGRETGGSLFARPLVRSKGVNNQLLIGHCDTVWPVETLQTLPLRSDNGKLRGPGIFDMKAGLTQMIFAVKALKELDLMPTVTPLLFINSDEEIGSLESKKHVIRLAKISKRAYILEPPLDMDGKLKTTRKGGGRYRITVKGKAAHAGLDPEKGVSAIVEMSHLIQKLFAMNNPEKGISVNIGMIEGGVAVNTIAPMSKAMIDVRVMTHEDAVELSEKIGSLKPVHPEVEMIIEGGLGRPPLEPTKRNRALWEVAKKTAQLINLDLLEGTSGGGSDGNFTSIHTATLDGLGTTGDGAHATHEFIFPDKLIERSTLLTMLMLAP